jgi:hypothetical protein
MQRPVYEVVEDILELLNSREPAITIVNEVLDRLNRMKVKKPGTVCRLEDVCRSDDVVVAALKVVCLACEKAENVTSTCLLMDMAAKCVRVSTDVWANGHFGVTYICYWIMRMCALWFRLGPDGKRIEDIVVAAKFVGEYKPWDEFAGAYLDFLHSRLDSWTRLEQRGTEEGNPLGYKQMCRLVSVIRLDNDDPLLLRLVILGVRLLRWEVSIMKRDPAACALSKAFWDGYGYGTDSPSLTYATVQEMMEVIVSEVDVVTSPAGWYCCKSCVHDLWVWNRCYVPQMPARAKCMYVVGSMLRKSSVDCGVEGWCNRMYVKVFASSVMAMSVVHGDASVDPVDMECAQRLLRESPRRFRKFLIHRILGYVDMYLIGLNVHGCLEAWLKLWFVGELQQPEPESGKDDLAKYLYNVLRVPLRVPLRTSSDRVNWFTGMCEHPEAARGVLKKYGLSFFSRDATTQDAHHVPEAVLLVHSLAKFAESQDDLVQFLVRTCVFAAQHKFVKLSRRVSFGRLQNELRALINILPGDVVVDAMDCVVHALEVGPHLAREDEDMEAAIMVMGVVGPYTSLPELLLRCVDGHRVHQDSGELQMCLGRMAELSGRWSANRRAWCSAVVRAAGSRAREEGPRRRRRRVQKNGK